MRCCKALKGIKMSLKKIADSDNSSWTKEEVDEIKKNLSPKERQKMVDVISTSAGGGIGAGLGGIAGASYGGIKAPNTVKGAAKSILRGGLKGGLAGLAGGAVLGYASAPKEKDFFVEGK
jgi:hypothetical protein